ncbi:type II secretion system minor pseudopilin GspK [Yersinia mollaretii]|uniref:type II secretion system minor pseudopilin GspK n=1 Tax=Yersinia mollaretii TaxID=33060 RepID=UPI0005DF051E|nr:type II secretion system minor pseudopilin GspK [Yersinia mollaretii]MDA5525069.1 type II secretion system minor pseudopilin GspK [Yersinia mollaretii]MDR7875409.1 type II secretion system minor pseudopilin GspK [Yersinia mollaretii]WQC75610.1 type II secretion system minor pseudopilin GspK [Yersinia mollaretii]CQJ08244.1 putative general secretion pathway protein K [Yersinia mollaretii]
MKNSQQSGMAMLVVLMITALMAITAVNMSDYGLRALHRATSSQFYLQSKWLLLSVESQVQRQQLSPLPTDKVHLGQPWARADQHIVLDGSQVNFRLRDRQSCFNLNALGRGQGAGEKVAAQTETPKEQESREQPAEESQAAESKKVPSVPYAQQVFQQLLLTQGVEATQAQNITLALADWMDKDALSRSGGSEASLYGSHRPRLVPANRPMLDTSEFRVIAGVDQALYLRLKPLICTLPTPNLRININTLSPAQAPLLAALFLGDMSVEAAQQLIARRPATGWGGVNDLKPLIADSNTTFAKAQTAITLTSNHFELRLWLDEEQRSNSMRSLFQRDEQVFQVISRQYGLTD